MTISIATEGTLLHHRIGGDLAFWIQSYDRAEGEERYVIDIEQHDTRLGWIPAPMHEVRGLCIDLDLPWAGMDRLDLVAILAEHLGADDPREPLDWDPPHYEMTDYDVDVFAREHGE
jgi:hypothetical protein